MNTISTFLRAMRPRQWTKNLFVFAPLIFSGKFATPSLLWPVVAAFVVFCMISGAVYIINDLADIDEDRLHETKRRRPLASGELSPRAAIVGLVLVLVAAAAWALALGLGFAGIAAAYLLLQVLYTFVLKHMVILDVFSIAAGFLLRAFAGAEIISTYGSPWLYVCAGLLALFLGLGKRRHELIDLDDGAVAHRPALGEYTSQFIDAMLSSVTAATIVTYALYTALSPAAKHAPGLILTVPFVMYGLFRYLYLIYKRNLGGNPEELLLTDRPLILTIVLWLAAAGFALYTG